MNFIVCEKIHVDREGNKYFTKILINVEKIQYIEPNRDNEVYVCLDTNSPEGYLRLNVSFDKLEQFLKKM